MKPEQIKETIKFKTEFLKFYFLLFLGISTGTITLLLKEAPDEVQRFLVGGGIVAIIVTLVLIVSVRSQIRNLVNKLS